MILSTLYLLFWPSRYEDNLKKVSYRIMNSNPVIFSNKGNNIIIRPYTIKHQRDLQEVFIPFISIL
jgi:hypothetical protein